MRWTWCVEDSLHSCSCSAGSSKLWKYRRLVVAVCRQVLDAQSEGYKTALTNIGLKTQVILPYACRREHILMRVSRVIKASPLLEKRDKATWKIGGGMGDSKAIFVNRTWVCAAGSCCMENSIIDVSHVFDSSSRMLEMVVIERIEQ